ncbi:MAG: hypothetical protein Q7R87_01260 [Nanoarchaeota archaeon]|nr:hypothetical protein [Nanoarchaeota archaeon]
MENERITKLILKPNNIMTSRGWSLAQYDNPLSCYSCKSSLFYVHITWGVVDETDMHDFKVLGRDHKYQYWLREIGFGLFCAECGDFQESYFKYFYPEDKVVCYWREDNLDLGDFEEIRHCLTQWNSKGDFKPNYNSSILQYLKNKLKEYELKKPKVKPIKR